jgi:hypothetical protein
MKYFYLVSPQEGRKIDWYFFVCIYFIDLPVIIIIIIILEHYGIGV